MVRLPIPSCLRYLSMLQLIRTLGVEKRWVFGLIFGGVALMFVFSMGGGGMSGPIGVYAAKVNGEEILLVDFNRAYQSRYKQMEKLYGDQFNEELVKQMGLRQQVVMTLIDRRLWLAEANRTGLYVSDTELADAVKGIDSFQVNNRFNSAHYKRLLSRVGMSPEAFENSMRQDILAAKVQELVRAGAKATKADLLQFAGVGNADVSAEQQAEQDALRLQAMERRKQAQLAQNYTTQLRAAADIHIYWDAIGVEGLAGT